MKESDLRKWHRRVGITITVFILMKNTLISHTTISHTTN